MSARLLEQDCLNTLLFYLNELTLHVRQRKPI